MISVQENYLPKSLFNPIYDWFNSKQPNWKFQPFNTGRLLDNYQFNISFYRHDIPVHEHYHIVKPLIDFINPHQLLRVKANLHPITESHQQSGFHTDFTYPRLTTAIFYINTNNGGTIFEYDQHIQPSVANTLVSFPAHINHASITTTTQKCRIVININYYTRPTITL